MSAFFKPSQTDILTFKNKLAEQTKAIDPDDLSDIYTEAILFIAVFGLLSIISFIISKKHAAQYAQKNLSPKQASPESVIEDTEAVPASDTVADADRLTELSKMLKDGLITEEEFQTLRQKLIS